MGKKRQVHEAAYKAKVAIEAVRDRKTMVEVSKQFALHPSQIQDWKRRPLERAAELFAGPSPVRREKHRKGGTACGLDAATLQLGQVGVLYGPELRGRTHQWRSAENRGY